MGNKYCKLVVLVLLVIVTASCATPPDKEGSSFNLYSGVKVEEYKLEQWRSRMIAIEGTPLRYTVTIKGYFSCENETLIPYLGVGRGGAVTLVLAPESDKAVFSSSCEEQRSIKISLEKRVRSGDVIYILSGDTVLGHVIAP